MGPSRNNTEWRACLIQQLNFTNIAKIYISMMIDDNANSWHKLALSEILYGNTYSNYKTIVKTQCKYDESM